jgi:aspartate kinase
MSLLALAINEAGVPATAFTGAQAGLRTDGQYGKASIVGVVPERVARAVREGSVAIVAGFQGLDYDTDNVNTLGRGGSDTTAVALAASLGADVCEIYTDVDGLFTADPRIVPTARRITSISSEETLELAAHGAKILHLRAVEFARRYHVPLHVRSSFSDKEGTWIHTSKQEDTVEAPIISGIAHDRSNDKLTIVGVRDQPGFAARIFSLLAGAGVQIDTIVQDVATAGNGFTNISLTIPEGDAAAAQEVLAGAKEELGISDLQFNPNVGTLSLVGAGMRSHPWVSAKLFDALFQAGINIHLISSSEIRISVVVDDDRLDDAVRAVHTAFDLDADQIEAVVYGGTGR